MRGKQAAASAGRKLEAAQADVARLEAELVEAKARARRHEDAARALPAVRQEVGRLQRLVDERTSDALEAERAGHRSDVEARNALVERMAKLEVFPDREGWYATIRVFCVVNGRYRPPATVPTFWSSTSSGSGSDRLRWPSTYPLAESGCYSERRVMSIRSSGASRPTPTASPPASCRAGW
jgi:hypothetical protein